MTIEVVAKYVDTPSWLGIDARFYTAAFAAWVGGEKPWAVRGVGINYAAPPPTLLALVLFYWMPPPVVSAICAWAGAWSPTSLAQAQRS